MSAIVETHYIGITIYISANYLSIYIFVFITIYQTSYLSTFVCIYLHVKPSISSLRMPGNEKKKESEGADPDPAPYLYLTFDMKRNDMLKPYDPKK